MMTLFPNFCMFLQDSQLCKTLKFQVQVTSVVPQGETLMATIHYQMAYRIQNHSLDIATPKNTHDIIFLNVDTTENHIALWSQSRCPKTNQKNSFPKNGMLPISSFNLKVFQLLSYHSQLIRHFIDPQVEDYLFPLHLHKMPIATQLYVFLLNFLVKKCLMKSNQRSMILLLKGKPYIYSSLVIPTLLVIDAFHVQSNLIPIIPQIGLDYLDANNNRLQSQKRSTQDPFWQRYKTNIPRYDLLGNLFGKYNFMVYYGKGDPLAKISK